MKLPTPKLADSGIFGKPVFAVEGHNHNYTALLSFSTASMSEPQSKGLLEVLQQRVDRFEGAKVLVLTTLDGVELLSGMSNSQYTLQMNNSLRSM